MNNFISLTRTRKNLAILVIAAILVVALAATTVAFLMRKSVIKNKFIPSESGVEVVETFDNKIKTNVKLKNTGTSNEYVRAIVEFNWVNADGEVYFEAVKESDLDITYNAVANDKWFKVDGIWYYASFLKGGEETQILIKKCSLKAGVTAPEGYTLSVDITAESIQDDADAVAEAWKNVTVSSGRLAAKA